MKTMILLCSGHDSGESGEKVLNGWVKPSIYHFGASLEGNKGVLSRKYLK